MNDKQQETEQKPEGSIFTTVARTHDDRTTLVLCITRPVLDHLRRGEVVTLGNNTELYWRGVLVEDLTFLVGDTELELRKLIGACPEMDAPSAPDLSPETS